MPYEFPRDEPTAEELADILEILPEPDAVAGAAPDLDDLSAWEEEMARREELLTELLWETRWTVAALTPEQERDIPY